MADIQKDVQEVVKLEMELADINNQIANEPKIVKLLQEQKSLNEKIAVFWEAVKNEMIDTGTKSIKGDWGYVTLVEKDIYKAPDISVIKPKFLKKELDVKKVAEIHKLTGNLPDGIEVSVTRYITKKIKEV